ncbi:MAG: hypothetical protein WDZ77_01685 [Candidatus Pacearchaeota archaeon]
MKNELKEFGKIVSLEGLEKAIEKVSKDLGYKVRRDKDSNIRIRKGTIFPSGMTLIPRNYENGIAGITYLTGSGYGNISDKDRNEYLQKLIENLN